LQVASTLHNLPFMPLLPLRISIMGPPGVLDAAGEPVAIPVGKPLALLVHLHLEGRPVPRDDLAAIFWPDSTPDRARASLRQALWLLRRGVGDGLLASDDPVALSPDHVTTDLEELAALERAPDPLAFLDRLWLDAPFRQFLIPELPLWEEWTELHRARAEARVGAVLLERAEEALGAGEPQQAAALLERAIRVQPFRTPLWTRRIEALLEVRALAEAEAVLAEARRLLQAGDEHDDNHDQGLLKALEQRIAAARWAMPAKRRWPAIAAR